METTQTINLQSDADAKKLFFLIHGYTGSPTDFNGLPEYLHKEHKADVKVILLKGHGTSIRDLDYIKLEDFLTQVEDELKKNIEKYDQVILGGVSFGAQLALHLAANYPVRGIFNVCLPYKLKFPFNVPGISILRVYKKYWPKYIPETERKLRQHAFHYQEMHINGLGIVKQANRLLTKELPQITCPILTIHSKNDPIGSYKSIKLLSRKTKGVHDTVVLDDKNHNVFFTDRRHAIYKKISDYVDTLHKDNKINKDKIAAIVPAYNEEKNIGRVLRILSKTKILDEVIVVDDGSTDDTAKEVSRFRQVNLLRSDTNEGKANALQRGIDATDAGILFFCDADLKGLTAEIIEQIIRPVKEKRYDMYIGVRNNVMQKVVTLFALNSGERVLRRELWEKLPDHFKYRYRIEAGLNFIASSQGKGYGWKKFEYYQTVKEQKYGFLKGTFLRWWMNLDVGYAYVLSIVQGLVRKIDT